MRTRLFFVIAFVALCVLGAALLPAMPQPSEYHQFADRRPGFGVANFLDVVSNIGFLAAGIAGLAVVIRDKTRFEAPAERWPYGVFFMGLVLTAAGSAYYAPTNESLFWDRLPMTIVFTSLVAAQVVDRISVRAGLALLLPLLVLGVGTVVYWIETERAGAGNLMPYAVLQGSSVALLLLVAWLRPSRYTRGNDIYWVFGAYAIAKVLEVFDREIFAVGNFVSGHSLKHLAAAVAGLVICRMLWLRDIQEPAAQTAVIERSP
jgi:hypothetical protein